MKTDPNIISAATNGDTSPWALKYARAVRGLVYALECNLATIEHMAMIKSSSKNERNRQCSIAQSTYQCLIDCGFDASLYSSRLKEIIDQHDGCVNLWMEALRESRQS